MPRVEIDGHRYIPATEASEAEKKLAQYRQEREDVIKPLRDLCERHGDNDWPEELHLRDIIEKHLTDYFE